MARPRYLVLVCQNVRPPTDPRGCCKMRGSEAILERFKAFRKEGKLSATYRATSTGCLGGCEAGPTVVVVRNLTEGSPADSTYYSGVRPEHVEEIVKSHLLGGRPIERLRSREEWID
jgi:(2Fe-2S) ferredoxin